MKSECKTCRGSGRVWNKFPFLKVCPSCGGNGQEPLTEEQSRKRMARPVSPPRPKI